MVAPGAGRPGRAVMHRPAPTWLTERAAAAAPPRICPRPQSGARRLGVRAGSGAERPQFRAGADHPRARPRARRPPRTAQRTLKRGTMGPAGVAARAANGRPPPRRGRGEGAVAGPMWARGAASSLRCAGVRGRCRAWRRGRRGAAVARGGGRGRTDADGTGRGRLWTDTRPRRAPAATRPGAARKRTQPGAAAGRSRAAGLL